MVDAGRSRRGAPDRHSRNHSGMSLHLHIDLPSMDSVDIVDDPVADGIG